MNLMVKIQDQASLALVFADDGALHSAARVLRELADEVEEQAVLADRQIDATIAEIQAESHARKAGA